MFKLSSFDAAKILGYVVAALSGITSEGLEAAGLPDHTASHVTAIVSIVTLSATLVVNAIKNQTPPAGTTRSVIPLGSIPVVATAPGTGVPSVARADPSVVLEVTSASTRPDAPPEPAAEPAPKSSKPIAAISQAIEKRAQSDAVAAIPKGSQEITGCSDSPAPPNARAGGTAVTAAALPPTPLPITVVSDDAFRTRLRALQAARAQLAHVATPAGASVGASVKEP